MASRKEVDESFHVFDDDAGGDEGRGRRRGIGGDFAEKIDGPGLLVDILVGVEPVETEDLLAIDLGQRKRGGGGGGRWNCGATDVTFIRVPTSLGDLV